MNLWKVIVERKEMEVYRGHWRGKGGEKEIIVASDMEMFGAE